MNYFVSIMTKQMFTVILSVLVLIGTLGSVANAQSEAKKLTPQEETDAIEFARKFWSELIEAKEIEPLLKKYAVSEFDDCLFGDAKTYGFAVLRDDQIREGRRSKIKRYYIAETNFLIAILTAGLGEIEDDPFSVLPPDVQAAITRKVWDIIWENDSTFDHDKAQSDEEANAYFDLMLEAMEKAAPLLRKYSEQNWKIGKKRLIELALKYEENASHAFEPELWIYDDGLCGMQPKDRRFIAIDIPLFQLKLTEIGGKFYVVQFPFHVD